MRQTQIESISRLKSKNKKRITRAWRFLNIGLFGISESFWYKIFQLPMRTIILLTVSNISMTIAWYGHLKYKQSPLFKVIIISWLIAFVEYCFQVPANRIGHSQFTAAQLKTIQEVITLIVFCIFSVVYLKEEIRWNYIVGFILMILAVFVIFKKW